MLKIISLFLFLISISSLSFAHCEGGAYQFSFKTTEPTLNLNYGLIAINSTPENMHKMYMQKKPTLGFTHTGYFLQLNQRITYGQNVGNGMYCANLDIFGTHGVDKLEVYIANEFIADQCQYQAILSHEMEHVRITQNYVNSIQPNIEQYIIFQTKQPVYGESEEDLNKNVRVRLHEIKQAILDFYSQAEVPNKEIDTPEAYQKVLDKCNNSFAERAAQILNP